MQVLDVLAAAVAAEGVSVAFNVPDEVTVFVSQALSDQGIRIVRPRHEQNGVLMADGYCRASGMVGICLVGVGPALAQTGSALVTAQRKGSPVLLLLGQNPREAKGALKAFDARRFVAAAGARYLEVRSPDTVAEDVQEAFRLVRLCRGPVVLAMPSRNELLSPHDERVVGTRAPRLLIAEPGAVPRSAAVEEAAAMLINARRPLIFAGRGAVAADAHDAIVALADRTGALLAVSMQAREYFAGHPRYIGLLGTFATDGVAPLLADADCILAVGVSLNPKQTGGRRLAPAARIIQIDADPARIGALSSVDLGVVGDARAVVTALHEALDRADAYRRDGWQDAAHLTQVKEAQVRPAPADRRLLPLRASALLAEFDAIFPADRFIVVDGGLFMGFVIDQISVPDAQSFLWTLDFSSIGLGLGMAIGAAIARPDRRVVLFAGDGGFAMNLQELDTLSRERVPVTVVILNDAAYSAETCVMDTVGKPRDFALFTDVDFCAVARGFGIDALTVRTVGDLADAQHRIRASCGPLIIDAKITEDEDHRYRRELIGRAGA